MPSGKKRTHEEFVKIMKDIHPDIEVIGVYEKANSAVRCRCLKCNEEWMARPANLTFHKSPTGCPVCRGNRLKSHDTFCNEVMQLHQDIAVVEQYKNSHTPMKFYCVKHAIEFTSIPTNILRRSTTGCPVCEQELHDGKLAAQIKEYCVSTFPGAIPEYRVLKNPETGRWLPYDVYIPNVNGEDVFCEIMGRQHYTYLKYIHGTYDNYLRQIARDDLKEQYANLHGRYVEIDARRIIRVEDAIPLILGENIGFIQRFAMSLDIECDLNSNPIHSTYSITSPSKAGGLKHLWRNHSKVQNLEEQ